MPNDFIYSVQPAVKGGAVTMSALDWDIMFGGPTDDTLNEHGAYNAVAWVRRCIELRCNALASIPAVIYRGTNVVENWPFANQLYQMLWLTEASLQLYGAAYWMRERNRIRDTGYRWLSPSTIKPKYDREHGLTHFERTLNGKTLRLELDDVLYVWEPNLLHETGPGQGWVSAVLLEANQSHYINQFASEFFERGAMPATVLSVEGNPPERELDRLQQWWRRLVAGVKRAFETVAVRATVTPIVVGYPTKDLAMPELMSIVRQQIAVAAGVPQTMLEDAANYATAVEHRQSFYTETVVPEATKIEQAWQRQLFEPQGLQFELDYQSLDLFQEDEAERAQALGHLVNAGVPLDLAMQMLGMELPGEMDYDDLNQRLDEDAAERAARAPTVQMPEGQLREQREELRRWQRKATRAVKDGKSADVDFQTDIIDRATQAALHERLSVATTEEEVKGAFAPPFQREFAGYP